MTEGSAEVRASAAASFAALAKDLQRAKATGLRKELFKGLSRASRPLKPAVVESARSTLPTGGGRGRRRTRLVRTGETLANSVSGRTHEVKRRVKVRGDLAPAESVADRVAAANYVTRLSSNGGGVRMRFVATERRGKKIDLYALNEGRLRHPLFGRRSYWYEQAVAAGWFTRPIEAKAGQFEKAIDSAVTALTDQINRA